MRVIVTGAGGFVGRQVLSALAGHDVVAVDQCGGGIPELPNVTRVCGDICDPALLEAAFAGGCDAVVHLATVPGGAAEAEPHRAWRVNVDATRVLAELASTYGHSTRFVFASSIAVFGSSMPDTVNDGTQLSPSMLYGAHKAMIEQWLATLNRRSELHAMSLRFSGVVARPRDNSGMKSAFLSDVFHAIRADEAFEMPVSVDGTSWLISVSRVAENIVRALALDSADVPESGAITLPALRVRMGDLVAEIARQAGNSPDLVSYVPDPALEAGFAAYPPLTTLAADGLGFSHDGDLTSLVGAALSALEEG